MNRDRDDVDASLGLGATIAASGEGTPRPLASGPALLQDPDAPLDVEGAGARYEVRAVLGEGGMGEVRLCRDTRIGRDVAVKVIRPGRRDVVDTRARFLREARVQGQLEHPAIVPVYDLGRGEDDEPFFVMRRVRGETLADVVERLARGDERARAEHTKHALLSLFVRICLAVDYAHARGVVHRDLKPGNVMLGRFGEVYVLDWGVAKVRGASETLDPRASRRSSRAFRADAVPDEERIDAEEGGTETGALLGTAGYMAPEQVRGSLDVDARTDVYALGAILFELLVLAPLHGTGTTSGILHRTLRPSVSDIEGRLLGADAPPELARVCMRAIALEPSARFPSARALSDAVEAYLAGDRDLVLRREMVTGHLDTARAASERALESRPDAEAERTLALAELGRALALDPSHADARAMLVTLLTQPPREPPPEVVAELAARDVAQLRRTLPFSAAMYVAASVAVFALGLLGVREAWMLVLPALAWLVTAGVAIATRNVSRLTYGRVPWTTIASVSASGFTALLFGPLVLAPVVVSINAMGLVLAGAARDRRLVVALAALALLGPLVAAWMGVFPVDLRADGAFLHLGAGAVSVPGGATLPVLAVLHFLYLAGGIAFVAKHRDALARAELREQMLAWQLAKVVQAPSLPRRRRPRSAKRSKAL